MGDQFCTDSINVFRSLQEQDSYVKTTFEVKYFMKNRYISWYKNILSRIRNTFVEALNIQQSLPKIAVIILEGDLIKADRFNDVGISELYGKQLEWLISQLHKATAEFKSLIPQKAQRLSMPHFLWILPSMHDDFSRSEKMHREKLSACLKSIVDLYENMSYLELIQDWEPSERALYDYRAERMTRLGERRYWISVDRAIMYCDKKLFNFRINQSRLKNSKLQRINARRSTSSTSDDDNDSGASTRGRPRRNLFRQKACSNENHRQDERGARCRRHHDQNDPRRVGQVSPRPRQQRPLPTPPRRH